MWVWAQNDAGGDDGDQPAMVTGEDGDRRPQHEQPRQQREVRVPRLDEEQRPVAADHDGEHHRGEHAAPVRPAIR